MPKYVNNYKVAQNLEVKNLKAENAQLKESVAEQNQLISDSLDAVFSQINATK